MVERVHGGVVAAQRLVGERSPEETDGRADTSSRGYQQLVDAELLAQSPRMEGCAATEGDHGEPRDVFAILHGMNPGGVGHVLVDHFGNSDGRRFDIHLERGGDMVGQCCMGRLLDQVDAWSAERIGGEAPEDQIGVGYRGSGAAEAVGGRARFGAGTEGADPDLAEHVHSGDRSAARADLDHLDHRDGDRHAAALVESVGAGHLEGLGCPGGLVLDEADLCRRTTHVVGEDGVEAMTGCDVGGEDRTTCRSGLHQAHREPGRGVDVDQTTA